MWLWHQAEPFGNNFPDENPSGLGAFDLPLRLPGQYFDKETNLHYNYFRDYDPGIGRYVESDPIGLSGGMNLYGYANQDPIRHFDRHGMQADSLGDSRGRSGIGFPDAISDASTRAAKQLSNLGKKIWDFCFASVDQCFDRWDKEDKDCGKWTGFGQRWVQACKDRAGHRLRLCYRNGGKPDPDEPPVWRPD